MIGFLAGLGLGLLFSGIFIWLVGAGLSELGSAISMRRRR